MEKARGRQCVAGIARQLAGEAHGSVLCRTRLVVCQGGIACVIHRHHGIVGVNPISSDENVLDNGHTARKVADLDLQETDGGHGSAAPIVCHTDRCPEGIVLPHGVDETRPSGLDPGRGIRLPGVGGSAAVSSHRQIHGERRRQYRRQARGVDHTPDGDRAGGGEARVDDIARWIRTQALRRLQVVHRCAIDLQIGEIKVGCGITHEERRLRHIADLRVLEVVRARVEHVGCEVYGLIVNAQRREVGKVVRRGHVVE